MCKAWKTNEPCSTTESRRVIILCPLTEFSSFSSLFASSQWTQSFSPTVGSSLYSEKACRVLLRLPRQQGKSDISRWSGKLHPPLHPGQPVCCIQRQPSLSARLLHQHLSASQSPEWRREPERRQWCEYRVWQAQLLNRSTGCPSALQPHQHTGNHLLASKELLY